MKQIPSFEKEMILTSLLNCNRTDLYFYRQEISPLIMEKFESVIKRRLEGEPLQYILGNVEFFGIEFRVDRRVFIPRPETELLVEEALKWLEGWKAGRLERVRILDIGTGCGNIAISIARMMQDVEILAVDISEEAIEVAKENAKLNGVSDRIEFLVGDLYKPIIEKNIKEVTEKQILNARFHRKSNADLRRFTDETICENPRAICENPRSNKFDCIVSNPPYIAADEFGNLQKEVLWEPRAALEGGLDGLLFIRQIICGAHRFLKDRGCLFLEIGYNQANRIERILRENNFKNIYFVKDYNGIERIVVGSKIQSVI